MRTMKLPHLVKRTYTNKAGQVWTGWYYQPPRGSGGTPGVRAKPVPLGDLLASTSPAIPPAEVLAAYAKAAGTPVQMPASEKAIATIYGRWLLWAQAEVKAGRLTRRTLADYETLWTALEPVFGKGNIDALTQPVLLQYFDKRSSKDRGKREVNFLGQLCAWARPRGYMVAANPVDRGLRLQMKVERTRRPTVPADVYWVVWQCADQLVRDTLDLSHMLATRPSEVIRVAMPEPGATELEVQMPKTARRGRAAKRVPITAELQALIDRRRQMNPHSLYVLFDERGQQLHAKGTVRGRFDKARTMARAVCKAAGIEWVEFARLDIRPTAITQIDKTHGRDVARRSAGHTTDKQTAHYVRPEAETGAAADLPRAVSDELAGKVLKVMAELASKGQQQ